MFGYVCHAKTPPSAPGFILRRETSQSHYTELLNGLTSKVTFAGIGQGRGFRLLVWCLKLKGERHSAKLLLMTEVLPNTCTKKTAQAYHPNPFFARAWVIGCGCGLGFPHQPYNEPYKPVDCLFDWMKVPLARSGFRVCYIADA